ncbi:MAG: hypothetical protein QM680_09560 [Luteolibacter sp.]
MKIIRKTPDGQRRETLLKEYFITASLIALLKRAGEQAARATMQQPEMKPAVARVRR